jgi:hypothetical protein
MGFMPPPRATVLDVCTNPEQVRSKHPVDLYESFCIRVEFIKKNV